MLILMGDMNAKLGTDNAEREREMAQNGLGEMNENGELLADFCAANSLVIGGTLFHTSVATWPPGFLLTSRQRIRLTTSW